MTGPISATQEAAMLNTSSPETYLSDVEIWWVQTALQAIDQRGRFDVALSGGSTPGQLYRRLSRNRLLRDHWPALHLWFGDERCVPPDHPQSNYRMVMETGLNPDLGLHLQRMEGEREPVEAATRYAERLKELPLRGGFPQFDLVMLGMGEDGHVASLFPGSANLAERSAPVAACHVEKLDSWRLSLTLPVIANARQVLVLVAGANKAQTLAGVLKDGNPDYPASALTHLPQVSWMIDRPAASAL
jgi:6-phosphogluconolactonase